ncbi:hypothetical protein L9F63_022836 [Diploptera punctata]|uniref:Uncharacterized protein n=1 Tax=Diploptera punctata TaxID=6984 RepID=A0AAD7ZLX4_DIPPU|nr:hypothetical protein L9F63_022836 [Diploptera punctata]
MERVPEYAEDISPYATFHVQAQGQGQQTPSSPGHMQTFVYHDHRLAAMETMQLKSANMHDDYTKLRANQKSKRLRSERSDYSSSTDCKSDLGPVSRPSRGERISLQTLLYPGPGIGSGAGEGPGGGPESSTSPEQSPVPDRRNPTRRHRHNVRRQDSSISFTTCLDPPTGFSDTHELSEAECDMDTIRRLKRSSKPCEKSHHLCGDKEYSHKNFTIAV